MSDSAATEDYTHLSADERLLIRLEGRWTEMDAHRREERRVGRWTDEQEKAHQRRRAKIVARYNRLCDKLEIASADH